MRLIPINPEKMFYSLKKAVMCKVLEKRKKQKPFDYERAEAFSLQGLEDSMVNNSYYFSPPVNLRLW